MNKRSKKLIRDTNSGNENGLKNSFANSLEIRRFTDCFFRRIIDNKNEILPIISSSQRYYYKNIFNNFLIKTAIVCINNKLLNLC